TAILARLVLLCRLLLTRLLTVRARLVVAALLALALLSHLLLRLAEHPAIVLGMLKKALGGDTVTRDLGITRQRLVLFDDLLRGAAHLAVRTCALKDAVDDIAHAPALVVI